MTIDHEVSVCIALIHNNNVQRNAYIRPQLEKMAGGLEPHIEVSVHRRIHCEFPSA